LKNRGKLTEMSTTAAFYVNMEGPAFSTRPESTTNHKLGYDVIGMTNLGEPSARAKPRSPTPRWR